MRADDPLSAPLKYHLDYLLELGKVRATRVVAKLSDGGVQGHANCKDTVDMVYLPISMGHRNCFKRMCSLGYQIRYKPDRAVIVDGIVDVKPSDSEHGYVSYFAYYNKWKRKYPQFKVSRPAEDICNYCFVFANCHRYLTNNFMTETLMTMATTAATTTMTEAMRTETALTMADKDDDNDNVLALVIEEAVPPIEEALNSIDQPKSAATEAKEVCKQLLLNAAVHFQMARAQRALYQAHVAAAVCNATNGKEHSV